LLVASAACRKDNKAEQLAALENAYRSGVLTQGEYDAKRLALMGPPPAPAAPVTPQPVANPVPPPQNPPSDTAAAPARAVEALPAPSRLPAPPPRQPAPVVTRSQAATGAAPVTQPPAAPPAHEPELPAVEKLPAVETRPAPQTSAGESEPEPAPLPGCEDAEYRSGKVKGARQRFYPAPVDSVKRAAGAALRSLDFNIHRDAGNEMEASKRRHISAIVGAGGERLILHFDKARQGNQAGTLVTGETRKSFVGRMAQKSWTNAVLAQIACHLREGR
jgi:hypothetical protein